MTFSNHQASHPFNVKVYRALGFSYKAYGLEHHCRQESADKFFFLAFDNSAKFCKMARVVIYCVFF